MSEIMKQQGPSCCRVLVGYIQYHYEVDHNNSLSDDTKNNNNSNKRNRGWIDDDRRRYDTSIDHNNTSSITSNNGNIESKKCLPGDKDQREPPTKNKKNNLVFAGWIFCCALLESSNNDEIYSHQQNHLDNNNTITTRTTPIIQQQNENFAKNDGTKYTTNEPTNRYYVLSIPQDLLQTVFEATMIRKNQMVRLINYQWVPSTSYTSTLNLTSNNERNYDNVIRLENRAIEILPNGMELISTTNSESIQEGTGGKVLTSTVNDLWTLQQIAIRETVDQIQKYDTQLVRYNFFGTINAISPVITVKPTTPFGLIELISCSKATQQQEKEEKLYSCIIVIPKSVLFLLSVFRPGDVINIYNIRRQQWKVPALLQQQQQQIDPQSTSHRLNYRIPDYVFIIEDPKTQIRWRKDDDRHIITTEPGFSLLHDNYCTIIRGIIVNVVYQIQPTENINNRDKTRSIHYVEMKLDIVHQNESILDGNNDHQNNNHKASICWLYVTYFPMSTNLQMSLRKGAYIQASNVQELQHIPTLCVPSTYCTSLRSHITILRASNEISSSLAQDSTASEKRPTMNVVEMPYSFRKIKYSYLELVWRHAIEKFISKNIRDEIIATTTEEGHKVQCHTFEKIITSIQRLMIQYNNHNGIKNDSNNNPYPNCEKPIKRLSRNPYFEFFGQTDLATYSPNTGRDMNVFEAFRCILLSPTTSDGLTSVHDNDESNYDNIISNLLVPTTVPQPIQLQHLHKLVNDEATKRTTIHIQHNTKLPDSLYIGWSASFVLSDLSLFNSCQLQSGRRIHPIVLFFGYVRITYKDDNNNTTMYATISNDQINNLPIIITNSTNSCNTDCTTSLNEGYAWVRLRYVNYSCICIGGNKGDRHRASQICHLPGKDLDMSDTAGPCSLFLAQGYHFIGSYFMVCDGLDFIQQSTTPNNDCTNEPVHDNVRPTENVSLENFILFQREVSDTRANFVSCLLVRKFFNLFKPKLGQYTGCTLHLADFWGDNLSSSVENITLQSIEIKPSVTVQDSAQRILGSTANRFLGRRMKVDQLTLVCAVWNIATSEKCCCVLAGGWDECLSKGDADISFQQGVVVRLPFSNLQMDNTRGYIRFRGNVEDLVVTIQTFNKQHPHPSQYENMRSYAFDFVGIRRFFPGMLDRRPLRRLFGDPKYGELRSFNPKHAGITYFSLASLHWALCQDLKNGNKKNSVPSFLSPSLVREIHGNFLGVSYCRALAECSKCFSSLRASNKANAEIQQNDNNLPAIASRNTTYWHLPLPGKIGLSTAQEDNKTGTTTAKKVTIVASVKESDRNSSKKKRNTVLCCPNGCRSEYAVIKWECSGTIDDGTGQARLYCERDAAICLLSMSVSLVESIEAGAWLNENGVVFSKAMPPRSSLQLDINDARRKLFDRRIPVTESSVLHQLNPMIRAEYLMQQYCRSSLEPMRKLIYFVRCKPLSDDVCHLNHTDITIAGLSTSKQSYSLPPLKLNLVDCATKNSAMM